MKAKHILNLVLFVVPLFVLLLLNVWFPDTREVSALENRSLKPMPPFTFESLFSGKYLKDYEDYLADHFTFRDSLVSVGKDIKEFRGFVGGEEVKIVATAGDNMGMTQQAPSADAEPGNGTRPDDPPPQGPASNPGNDPAAVPAVAPPDSTPDPSEEPVKPGNEPDEQQPEAQDSGQLSGRMLILKDRAMYIYTYDEASAKQYANVLNGFQKKLRETGLAPEISSLIVPSAVEYLEQSKYRKLSGSQAEALDMVGETLDASIRFIRADLEIGKHRDEYLYFRTDHHWTGLGAYYAYTAYTKDLGLDPVPLDRYETKQYKNFLGSLYNASLDPGLKENPDTITLYLPRDQHTLTVTENDGSTGKRKVITQSAKKGYSNFMGGDFPYGHIATEAPDGNLLIVKDSYANAFMPFLIPHYRNIYIVDLRHYDGDVYDLIRENAVDQVLFVNNSAVTTHTGYTRILEDKLGLK